MTERSLYFTAGDPSGDVFSAEVMDALTARASGTQFRAVGGRHMAARASRPEIDISSLDILGFWEGIRAYPDVARLTTQIADDIIAENPDAVVLTDSWGLSIRVAQKVRAKDRSIRLIKLIGPQIWASRAGRAKTLAKHVDAVLCIHDFEPVYYEPYGLKTCVIGHPSLARTQRREGTAFRAANDIAPDVPFVLVLPGSRASEIDRVAGPLVAAARALSGALPDIRIGVAPAGTVLERFRGAFPDLPPDWILLDDGVNHAEAMAAADLALSCSGTVNNELAVQGTPFVTGYKVAPFSWFLMKNFLLKAEFVTLLNMAAGKMVAPELLQDAFTPVALAGEAQRLLADPALRAAQRTEQDQALKAMGWGKAPAATVAADAILAEL